MAQNNVIEASNRTPILTESIDVELHFTKAMLKTYNAIAKKEGVSFAQALNRTFLVAASGEIDAAFDGDEREHEKMQSLWKQVERERDQAWKELDQLYKEKARVKRTVLFTLKGDKAKAYADRMDDAGNYVRLIDDEKGNVKAVQFYIEE